MTIAPVAPVTVAACAVSRGCTDLLALFEEVLDPNGLLCHATKEVARLLFFVPFDSLAPRLRIVHHTRVEGAHRILRQRGAIQQSPTARFAVVALGHFVWYCTNTVYRY